MRPIQWNWRVPLGCALLFYACANYRQVLSLTTESTPAQWGDATGVGVAFLGGVYLIFRPQRLRSLTRKLLALLGLALGAARALVEPAIVAAFARRRALAITAAVLAGLWIAHGYAQNGRYALQIMPPVLTDRETGETTNEEVFVLDTRTGDFTWPAPHRSRLLVFRLNGDLEIRDARTIDKHVETVDEFVARQPAPAKEKTAK